MIKWKGMLVLLCSLCLLAGCQEKEQNPTEKHSYVGTPSPIELPTSPAASIPAATVTPVSEPTVTPTPTLSPTPSPTPTPELLEIMNTAYDTELFLEVIEEADANADVVIACVHWGTEYSTVLEEAQLTTGKLYLDAGADVIVGSHSHCLQGMEFYEGKPIIYSLGNFWINRKSLDTMLLQLHITGEKENPQIDVMVIPALQENYCTTILTESADKEKLYEYLESISINVEIDENGTVKER